MIRRSGRRERYPGPVTLANMHAEGVRSLAVSCWLVDIRFASAEHSDRPPVTVEFVILDVSALIGAEVSEVMNKLDRCDPLHHLEPKLIFETQPQWCAV